MLEKNLTKSLLAGLTPPNILKRTVESMVSLNQFFNVANQLDILSIGQSE